MEALQRFIGYKESKDFPNAEKSLKEMSHAAMTFKSLPPSVYPPEKQEFAIYCTHIISFHA